MTWQTTYPTVATFMAANFTTLQTWADNLPAPQTDVELTIHRRLLARRDELARQEVRATRPDIADKFNEVYDHIERLTGLKPAKRF